MVMQRKFIDWVQDNNSQTSPVCLSIQSHLFLSGKYLRLLIPHWSIGRQQTLPQNGSCIISSAFTYAGLHHLDYQ
jgi:hypothetical protein